MTPDPNDIEARLARHSIRGKGVKDDGPRASVAISEVKDHIHGRKKVMADTKWRRDAIAPRFGPYDHTRPCAKGWQWRSISLETLEGQKYRMLCEADPARGKWKAVLILVPESGPGVAIARFEDQPGNRGGGLHVHANCDQNADLKGAESLQMAYILPEHGRRRRRSGGWTLAKFCSAAGKFFRTDSIESQEEMSL